MLGRIVISAQQPPNTCHMVVSLTGEDIHGPAIRASGVQLYCLNIQKLREVPLAFWSLVRLLHRYKPDVIMTWLYHADLFGTFAAITAGLGRKRLVWNLRCSDIDFSRYAYSTKIICRLLAYLSFLPAQVITNSQAGRRHHLSLGYKPQKWGYLPNGFDTSEWYPDAEDRENVRIELGLSAHDVAIVVVARNDPQKDHTTFLAAADKLAKRYSKVKFILIGRNTQNIPLPTALRNKMIVLGERTDVARLLRGMDIAVLSSAYGEGFPNVVGEAMATGLPCVVTDVGDSALIVEDTGIVVPPRNADSLADAIQILIDDPDLQNRGAEARRIIIGCYSIDVVRERYQKLFSDIHANSN